jgi:hypothetical protein
MKRLTMGVINRRSLKASLVAVAGVARGKNQQEAKSKGSINVLVDFD